MIALDKAGLLGPLREDKSGKKVVVEIGGGWGGFAYQMKTLCPGLCYIIVDLPQTLLFSAVYLMTLFPEARSFVYGDSSLDISSENLFSHDFVFLPHYIIRQGTLPKIDLTINMVSFQEMTDDQVLDYVRWSWESGCPDLYSHNRGRSPHNTQLSLDVDSLVSRGYVPEDIKILSVPYTVLEPPIDQRFFFRTDPKEMAKVLIRRVLASKRKTLSRSLHRYRHVAWHKRASFQE
jgi:hypothetical protein